MTDLTEILPALAGWPPAAVALELWPALMRCARETLVPWVDAHLPELAGAVRIAFHDLREVSADLHLTVRAAWTRLRRDLLAGAVAFVTAGPGGPAVRMVVWLRPWSTGPAVVVSAEHRLDLPLAVHRLRLELVSPRDRLLGCGGGR